MKKIIMILIAALLIPSGLVFAAPYYDVGDQFLAITAGPTTPILYNSEGENVIGPGFGEKGKITLGGIVSIGYEVFVTNYLAVGGEIGYQFNFARNGNVLTSVPIHVKMTYLPIQGRFELPISFSIGANYLSFEDRAQITFSATVSIGVNFFIDDHWGIGINAGLSILPELYAGDPGKNGIDLDLPTTISAIYRH